MARRDKSDVPTQFVPERNPDTLPDSHDPSGPCPRCGRVSSFEITGQAALTFSNRWVVVRDGERVRDHVQRLSLLECQGCRDDIVVVEDLYIGGKRWASDDPRSGAHEWRGIHWWPSPGSTATDPAIPQTVASAYGEGVRCLSAQAPNGACAMFRVALAHLVDDKGSVQAKQKRDLKDKIAQMVTDGHLPPSLGEWATHIRLTGNAGAHPDVFGDVSMEEAQDLSRLTASLFEVLYVVPATIARRQAERERPSQPRAEL